jgi:hypothetical protein
MTYALARFQPRPKENKSIVESVKDAANVATLSGTLAAWSARKKKQLEDQRHVIESMRFLQSRLEEQPDIEDEDMVSPLRKILTKILKFCAKKVFKYVVRPILRFAARIMMNLVRVVLTSIVDFVIVPAIELVVTFAIANPVTAALGAILLVGGGAYFLWDKFFAEKPPEPKIPQKDIDLRGEPELGIAEPETRRSTPAATQYQQPAIQPEAEPSIVSAPLEFIKEQYHKVTGKKFTGFGEDVDSYIKEAAAKYGIPEDVLRGFVKMEAGWTGAMSPTGAIGTGQFIQPTWDAMAATPEGKAIGMTKIGDRFRTSQDPRFNKRVNTLATGLLAKNNAKILQQNGLPLTGENLYMMHNIGPGIIDVMLGRPASAATLKAMQQNGMLKGQNAAQFLAYQKGRFASAYAEANLGTTVNPTNPRYTEGISVAAASKSRAPATQTTPDSKAGVAAASPDKTIIKDGKKLIALG